VSERSACNACSRAPCRRATSASSGLLWRASVMTVAPRVSSSVASARPRPRLAPVTTATVVASMSSDSLLEAGDDERIEIAVQHLLGIGDFHVGAQILDAALVEHVGT